MNKAVGPGAICFVGIHSQSQILCDTTVLQNQVREEGARDNELPGERAPPVDTLTSKLLLRLSVTEYVCQAEAKEASIPNNWDVLRRKVRATEVPSSPLWHA